LTKAFLKLLAIGLASTFLGTSVGAQDGSEDATARTPGAAQAFLSNFLPRGGWVVRSSEWYDGTTYRYFDGNGWIDTAKKPNPKPSDELRAKMVLANVTSFDAVGACTARVSAEARGRPRLNLEDPERPVPPSTLTITIDWKNVNQIQLSEDRDISRRGGVVTNGWYELILYDPNARYVLQFLVTDKSRAERAAFAMNYLQQQCDPSAGTAF
jgi:hypothetical protein